MEIVAVFVDVFASVTTETLKFAEDFEHGYIPSFQKVFHVFHFSFFFLKKMFFMFLLFQTFNCFFFSFLFPFFQSSEQTDAENGKNVEKSDCKHDDFPL